MPPKPKITKDMILNTALTITRETGFETVNARSISAKMRCFSRPFFTCYENMEKLKRAFLDFAFDDDNQYFAGYKKSKTPKPYLLLPRSYIDFAKREAFPFQLLFIQDMDLDITDASNF